MRSRQVYQAAPPSNPLTASTVLLFVGALLLLLASLWIVIASRRGGGPVASPAPPIAIVTPSPAAAVPSPVTPTALVLTVPPLPVTPPTVATPGTPTLPTATPRPRLPTPTARQPNATLNGCALVLPPGFREESPGYYPATDGSGYVALDRFVTPAGQRPLEDLTAAFVQSTITHTLSDFRQTAAVPSGDGYRLDFTASAAGRPGKGTFYLKRFGAVACGVTLFLVDGSAIQPATTLDLLILSLQVVVATPSGTPVATPSR